MLFGPRVNVEDFEAAALPYLDELYRTAARVIGDRTQAEDLVQEVCLQAWKSFHRFTPGTNARAWLFKILFHAIHHYRRQWFHRDWLREDSVALEQTLPYEPPVPEQLSDEAVLSALQKIPQEFREVVLLADVQEFSYREIAEMLEIPVGTVMSRLSRGRRLLRVELAAMAAYYGIKPAIEKNQGRGL